MMTRRMRWRALLLLAALLLLLGSCGRCRGEQDHYRVLEVSRSASVSEIRAAHRRLARKYHPDKSKTTDTQETFIAVQNAWETLSDPDKKAEYDDMLRYDDAGYGRRRRRRGGGGGGGGGRMEENVQFMFRQGGRTYMYTGGQEAFRQRQQRQQQYYHFHQQFGPAGWSVSASSPTMRALGMFLSMAFTVLLPVMIIWFIWAFNPGGANENDRSTDSDNEHDNAGGEQQSRQRRDGGNDKERTSARARQPMLKDVVQKTKGFVVLVLSPNDSDLATNIADTIRTAFHTDPLVSVFAASMDGGEVGSDDPGDAVVRAQREGNMRAFMNAVRDASSAHNAQQELDSAMRNFHDAGQDGILVLATAKRGKSMAWYGALDARDSGCVDTACLWIERLVGGGVPRWSLELI